MVGLTIEQARLLKQWSKDLWVLLDQSDFDNIQKIFENAVGREEEHITLCNAEISGGEYADQPTLKSAT